ncbi:MAG: hypothetical protein ABH875_06085 [Candidatus Omnitrophota bacterium]
MAEKIAFIAAIMLPLWNIPLITRIIRRKSSDDISMYWVLGVWACFLLMAPDGLRSEDPVWRMFNIMNLIMFSGVVITVLAYKKEIRELIKGKKSG